MATKKISQLTPLTTANNSIEFLINDAGVSKKITRANIFSTGIDVTGSVTADGLTVDDIGTNAVRFQRGASQYLEISANSSAQWLTTTSGTNKTFILGTTDSNRLELFTNNSTRMTITSTGNVGIGTTSPSSSSGYANLTLDGSNSGWVELRSGGAAVADWYSSGGNEVTFRALQQGMNLTVGGANNSFKVATNGSERLRITSTGNVGLGVTPESWHSSYTSLQIGDTGALAGVDGATDLSENRYVNSSYIDTYINTSEASRYRQNTGKHTFQVAPSGTANSTSITSGKGYTITATGGNFNPTFGAA
ncbi:MAG: hypothetical protein ABGY11_09430, partial [Candidatus Thioglobus sp.]